MEYKELNEQSYIGIGKAYLMLERYDESIDCLKKAI